ncbi:uncharacterized protein LACBIDRAFT_308899 [Laccaria bicolor S238N-H82]|uniref:Predicted protein n=1 Tax=Laccaria bicolor (strain S238N-H82 / ATCC MYA-4686) TaxID=486041 RepID=B0CV12_LACBS|nr:uncharacterized protein LACBIDRAFT_308899 [Laccaria bicolor S238N-H82]EDR13668.1 predicted protein [Laccaria bicolor S238N-H82]|eukprot:XP_001876166.1 predicted protein [Laccaria bicolor S238N-H82]
MPPRTRANKKRKLETTPDEVASVDLEDGWLDKFTILPPDELARVIAHIANHGRVNTAAIKKARMSLPSFSGVKWVDLAARLGLDEQFEKNEFETFVTPMYLLPPSLHEIMFEAEWLTQHVYQERQAQSREAARIRMMDPYLVRIIGLFQGRLIDLPEQAMLETEYASGGEVEHEIVMIGGILFFIAEFKLGLSLADNVAQLFAEKLAAAKANKKADFGDLRVYGLLTDLTDFHFYSYDPVAEKFAFDETLIVNITRNVSFTDMIPVGNKIFSLILSAYIDGLEATTLKSLERGGKGDISSPGSAPIQQMGQQKAQSKRGRSRKNQAQPGPSRITRSQQGPSQSQHTHGKGRISTDGWQTALQFAKQCRDKFEEQADTVDDVERNSAAALELLANRYSGFYCCALST